MQIIKKCFYLFLNFYLIAPLEHGEIFVEHDILLVASRLTAVLVLILNRADELLQYFETRSLVHQGCVVVKHQVQCLLFHVYFN